MADRIEEIRNNFFAKVKEDEEKKERAIEETQSKCSHEFNAHGRLSSCGKFQPRRCMKCNYSLTLKTTQWKFWRFWKFIEER